MNDIVDCSSALGVMARVGQQLKSKGLSDGLDIDNFEEARELVTESSGLFGSVVGKHLCESSNTYDPNVDFPEPVRVHEVVYELVNGDGGYETVRRPWNITDEEHFFSLCRKRSDAISHFNVVNGVLCSCLLMNIKDRLRTRLKQRPKNEFDSIKLKLDGLALWFMIKAECEAFIIRQKLGSLRYAQDLDMLTFFKVFDEHIHNLEKCCGQAMSDAEKIHYLKNALQPCQSVLAKACFNLWNHEPDHISYPRDYEFLKNQHIRYFESLLQEKKTSERAAVDHENNSRVCDAIVDCVKGKVIKQQLRAAENVVTPGTKMRMTARQCFICEAVGHYTRLCPDPQKAFVRCTNCGELGTHCTNKHDEYCAAMQQKADRESAGPAFNGEQVIGNKKRHYDGMDDHQNVRRDRRSMHDVRRQCFICERFNHFTEECLDPFKKRVQCLICRERWTHCTRMHDKYQQSIKWKYTTDRESVTQAAAVRSLPEKVNNVCVKRNIADCESALTAVGSSIMLKKTVDCESAAKPTAVGSSMKCMSVTDCESAEKPAVSSLPECVESANAVTHFDNMLECEGNSALENLNADGELCVPTASGAPVVSKPEEFGPQVMKTRLKCFICERAGHQSKDCRDPMVLYVECAVCNEMHSHCTRMHDAIMAARRNHAAREALIAAGINPFRERAPRRGIQGGDQQFLRIKPHVDRAGPKFGRMK